METILERLKCVMKLRGWSEREWARAAQLPEPSNVNKLIRRLKSHPEEFPGDARTLQKLADAAGVTMDWLALGRGSPLADGFAVRDDPRYPSRAAVAVAGILMGFPREAVEAMLGQELIGVAADPGADYWLQVLLLERAKLAAPPAPQISK